MLENKLGLTTSADLARAEERISKKKAIELFEQGILDLLPAGRFSTLQAIHRYLFSDFQRFMISQGRFGQSILPKGTFGLHR